VAAGSGLATFGRPSSAGVPEAFTSCTRVLPLDDEAAAEALFAREGPRIAALIIEPLPANHGLLPQRHEFLAALRRLTRAHGALLIFDEVISGFRVGRGGAAELTGIAPDMATFGKVIGGGMPVGAFGGARAVMEHLAPLGDTYQAGTLSGNPVAMASGLATLDLMLRDSGWQRLEARGAELERLVRPVLAQAPFPVHLVRVGSLFWLALHEGGAPRTAATLSERAAARFAALFHAMLDRGVYLPPSGYEACFLSLAHSSADLSRFAQALRESLAAVA
jgi:glutamate-1-semialdehyde 2,1-aminomutase